MKKHYKGGDLGGAYLLWIIVNLNYFFNENDLMKGE